jgi:hypothetical protein
MYPIPSERSRQFLPIGKRQEAFVNPLAKQLIRIHLEKVGYTLRKICHGKINKKGKTLLQYI